jgi:hypothetical protein
LLVNNSIDTIESTLKLLGRRGKQIFPQRQPVCDEIGQQRTGLTIDGIRKVFNIDERLKVLIGNVRQRRVQSS